MRVRAFDSIICIYLSVVLSILIEIMEFFAEKCFFKFTNLQIQKFTIFFNDLKEIDIEHVGCEHANSFYEIFDSFHKF